MAKFFLCMLFLLISQMSIADSPHVDIRQAHMEGDITIQKTLIQPIEWIVRETVGQDQWGYVSPDGENITFSRSLDGRTFHLLIVNRHDQQPRPFLIDSPADSITRGAWSRPHHRLAFIGNNNRGFSRWFGGTAIYVADASGQNVQRIPAIGISNQVFYPSWMPDGRSVVVVDFGAPGGSTLYRIDIESGISVALTNPSDVLAGMPCVSPDGQLIAFAGQSNHGSAYDQTKNQIWLMSIGGHLSQVSAGQGRQPDWSPDGQWLAFTSNRGDPTGRHAVFIVDRTGRKLIQLTDYSSNAQHPVWAPDGTWLLFSAEEPERSGIYGLARIIIPDLSTFQELLH